MARKKKELTITEIMDLIIDKDMLEERKRKTTNQSDITKGINEDEDSKSKKEDEDIPWWKSEMKKSDFKVKKLNGKLYIRNKNWGDRVCIGPYDSEGIVKEIIDDYVRNSKLPISDRTLDLSRIHSIIL